MKERIQSIVREFVRDYKIRNKTTTDWEEPLVGFANADDNLFLKLRTIVSETHKIPTDLLEDAKTVISYFIPLKKNTVLSNVGDKICSKEWAVAFVETNELTISLNKCLEKELEKFGFRTKILPSTHNFDEKKLASDWSHKHVAFIVGLGKFGLHQMLITEKGCCGRLGGIITRAKIEPTERPDEEFCLYKKNKTCKKCVEKCSFEALKVESFDRHKCYEVCLSNAKLYSELGLVDVCGKCICLVPCSFRKAS